MRKSTINQINQWIEELLIEDKDSWDMDGADDISPPTISELEQAFDLIQSEAVKEDARAQERARVKAISAFRMLVIE